MYRLINKNSLETIRRSRNAPTLDGSQPDGIDENQAWVTELTDDIEEHDSRIFKVVTTEEFDLTAYTVTAKHELVRREKPEILNTLVGILHRKQDEILPSRSRERLIVACLYEVIKAAWPDLNDAPLVVQQGLQILGAVEANETWFATMETRVEAGTITTEDLDS